MQPKHVALSREQRREVGAERFCCSEPNSRESLTGVVGNQGALVPGNSARYSSQGTRKHLEARLSNNMEPERVD